MGKISRRLFLGSALGGLSASYPLAGQELKKETEQPKVKSTLRPVVIEEAAFQPATLFLTWHKDPTTTMVVQWVGVRGETEDNTIYYTSDRITSSAAIASPTVPAKIVWQSQKTFHRPYPMSDFKVFRAELTGLKPGTDYAFRIGKSSPTYKFRTMPAKADDTISFVSGGDCGVNSAAIANNMQAARQDPMFAVIGGDLGYDNGRSLDVSLAFLRNYSRTMIGKGGRLIPLIATLGNHEVDGGYGKSREKATFFFPLFEGLYSETSYGTLDFGDYLSLVLLDTGHTSPIGGEQADWLQKTLKERESHPNVFVINHVPCYPSYRSPLPEISKDATVAKPGTGELQRKHWTPLFDQYRVPVVLEHHDHAFKRTKPLISGLVNDNGVLYLGDGSWGRLRSPQKADKLHVMAKVGEDYHLSLHRIEGEERFHLAIDEQGKVMDVSRSGQRKKGAVAVPG